MDQRPRVRVDCGAAESAAPGSVLAVALEAFVSITDDGRVVGWNPAAEATFGYPTSEACGAPVEDLIIPERFHAAHRAGLARVAAGGPGRVLGQRLQLSARHRDGHEFPIELTLTVTDGPAGRRFHAFAHDVTARHRAQRHAAVESAVAHGLAGADSSDRAAMRVAESLGVHMGWPVVELWIVDEDRQMLTCRARFVTAGRDMTDFAVDELEYDAGLPGKVYRERRPVWVPDLAVGRLVRSDAAARYGLHVAVAVPICSGDHVLGVLAVYGHAIEDPEDALVGLLGGLAAHVGQFLERRRAEELAVELARTKDEFVTMVTHELRNPVATIASAAELLEGELDAESAERLRPYLAMIARSAERLGAMAADLLDLAGLESGQPTVHRQHIDLGQILHEAVDAMLPAAGGKELTLTADLSGPLALYADPHRLRQVADNLLSNAVKYTPAGGRIAVTARPGPDETVEWSVSDTGIGIPAAERPRLFRRFYRASTALDRRIPGTGLGLVVARAIVERHQGTIAVAEHDGPGTTFHIRLPAKPAP